jgi:hypothetical protein
MGTKKKAGKKKIPCQAYKNSNTRERNKIRKLQRHLKHVQPDDPVALAALEKCKKVVKGF